MKNRREKTKTLQLFLSFLKIGAFTFGGGYAMIPLIHRETVDKHGFITDDEMLEMIAISESTPGPISINTATFVGYRVDGYKGAAAATLGAVLPSLVIIMILSFFLRRFMDLKAVRYAFYGIRAGVAALVAGAFVNMTRRCPKNILSYAFMALAFLAVTVFNVSAVLLVFCGAVLGILIYLAAGAGGNGR